MALRWEDKKVALEIDDDLLSRHFDAPDDWKVIHVSSKDLEDYESFNTTMRGIHEALNSEEPYVNYPIELFEAAREQMKFADRETNWVLRQLYPLDLQGWSGDAPSGSIVPLKNGEERMTPEFKFLVCAATQPISKTVQLGMELCGYYATDHDGKDSDFTVLEDPFCTVEEIRDYLRQAKNLDGYSNAMEAIGYVMEGSLSPMSSYIAECLCLPRCYGGYDLTRPTLGGLFDAGFEGMGRAPSEEGPYVAYDLCWPWAGLAMQYVGDTPPTPRERRSLEVRPTFDIETVCVTTQEVKNPKTFEEAVRLLASKLEIELPESDPDFLKERALLRSELTFPAYDHMALTHTNAHFHETL